MQNSFNDITKSRLYLIALLIVAISIFCANKIEGQSNMNNIYPWCIVAFDSLQRTPLERISMIKNFGFTKYAYDWRDIDLDEMEDEIKLANKNGLEIISVWLWLNAKRDNSENLSSSNERMFEVLKNSGIRTTIWLSFNNNFFEGLDHKKSLKKAIDIVSFICEKANSIGCKVALYNHGGWFGEISNQVEIIKSIPQLNLSIVYNFHHGHQDIDKFSIIVNMMKPYLSWVNLNGMKKEGPKILTFGKGDHEIEMIDILIKEGFKGPWGILGHVENEDVEKVLQRNLIGVNLLGINRLIE